MFPNLQSFLDDHHTTMRNLKAIKIDNYKLGKLECVQYSMLYVMFGLQIPIYSIVHMCHVLIIAAMRNNLRNA